MYSKDISEEYSKILNENKIKAIADENDIV